MKTIIAIGRQYGSGGRQVGKLLAAALGIPFYDRVLIEEAARQSGIDPRHFERGDETAAGSFLFAVSMGLYGGAQLPAPAEYSVSDRIFFAQADVIRQAAANGPCVIVGRCADYILRERSDLLSVFLYADRKDRMQRAVREYGVAPEHAEEQIQKMDKRRGSYYAYYTGRRWQDIGNYGVMLSTSVLGVNGAARLLERAVLERETHTQPV